MKLKSITAVLGQHTCSRCHTQSHEGWEICVFDGSKWYVCESCMVQSLPEQELINWSCKKAIAKKWKTTMTNIISDFELLDK